MTVALTPDGRFRTYTSETPDVSDISGDIASDKFANSSEQLQTVAKTDAG
jgi:hypothetical protein